MLRARPLASLVAPWRRSWLPSPSPGLTARYTAETGSPADKKLEAPWDNEMDPRWWRRMDKKYGGDWLDHLSQAQRDAGQALRRHHLHPTQPGAEAADQVTLEDKRDFFLAAVEFARQVKTRRAETLKPFLSLSQDIKKTRRKCDRLSLQVRFSLFVLGCCDELERTHGPGWEAVFAQLRFMRLEETGSDAIVNLRNTHLPALRGYLKFNLATALRFRQRAGTGASQAAHGGSSHASA